MEKIKVRTIFGNHAIYQEMVNYPPKNIEYSGFNSSTSKGKYYDGKESRAFVSRTLAKLRIPRFYPIIKCNEDLIHTSRGLIPLQVFSNKPWIMDLEHATIFLGLYHNFWNESIFAKSLVKNSLESKDCKKIMPHCNASKLSLLNTLDCNKFKDKIEVLYPATHLPKIKYINKKNDKLRLLFVSSLFEEKGGYYVLEAFKQLENKYDLELWIKADVSSEVKEKYNSKNIKYFPYRTEILSRDKLIEDYYTKSDVFLYPSFCDSFGYGLLDAMTAKLPIVASNMFAIPEIVENGKNGFIVNILGYSLNKGYKQYLYLNDAKSKAVFIKDFTKKIELLINDNKLRKYMGDNSFELVSKGKFSIDYRNKQLRKIYESALD